MQVHAAAVFQHARVVGVLLQRGGDRLLMLTQLRKRRDVRRRLRNQSSVRRDQIAEQFLRGNRCSRKQPPGASVETRDLARDQRQMQHAFRENSVSGRRRDRDRARPSRFAVRQLHGANFIAGDNQQRRLFRDPRQEQSLVASLFPQELSVARVEAQQLGRIRRSNEHAVARGDEYALSPR